MTEKFFQPIGNDKHAIPTRNIVREIFSRESDVKIRNGHISMMIPGETIQKIKSLDPSEQCRIKEHLRLALKDSSKVTLTPIK